MAGYKGAYQSTPLVPSVEEHTGKNTDAGSIQFNSLAVGDHYISAEIHDAETGVDNFVMSQDNNAWVGFRDGAFKAQFITAGGSYFPFVGGFDFIGNNFFSVSIRDGQAVISDGVTTQVLTDPGIGSISNYSQIGGRSGSQSNVTFGEVVLYDLDDATNSSVFNSDSGTTVDLVGTRNVTQDGTTTAAKAINAKRDPSPFLQDMADIKAKYIAEAGNPITGVTSGNIGEIFAFTGANWLMFYVEAYKKTEDTFWLDKAVEGVEHMFQYTDKARFDRAEITCAEIDGDHYTEAPKFYLNNDGVPGNGWRRTFGPGWSLSVLVAGVILSAVSEVIQLIKDKQITQYYDEVEEWLDLMLPIFLEHDTSWSETKHSQIDGSWFFVNVDNPHIGDPGLYGNPLAFNHSLKLLTAMARYDSYRSRSDLRNKITKFLEFFDRHLFEVGGEKIWWYAYDINGNTKTEDVNHGAYDIRSFAALADLNLLDDFYLKDLTKAITKIAQYGRSGLLHYRLDALDGGLASDTIASAADNLAIAGEWDIVWKYNQDILDTQRDAVGVLLSQANTPTNYWAVYWAAMTVLPD